MPAAGEHIVVVGAGLAGLRTVEQLRAAGHTGRITLIGAEEHPPYDRPPLSKQVLTGAWEHTKTSLADEEKLAGLDVTCRFGTLAAGLDGTTVRLADGTSVRGDAVVLATGVVARRLPGQPDGVHTLRTLGDSLALRDALAKARSLLVVGAGFIGAEVASAAVSAGLEVTVLEALPVPLARALGEEGGALAARLLTEAGVNLRCGTPLAGFADEHTVSLADGSTVSADIVLVGIGGAPDLAWLEGSGLDISNGIACDTNGRAVGVEGVWAVGDAAAWQSPERGRPHRNEHWTSATDQAAVVARDILGAEPPAPTLPYFWSDQFGLKIQLIGHPDLADSVTSLHGEGLGGGPVKGTVLGYFTGDELVAVAAFGAAAKLVRYRALLSTGADRAKTLEYAATLEQKQAPKQV